MWFFGSITLRVNAQVQQVVAELDVPQPCELRAESFSFCQTLVKVAPHWTSRLVARIKVHLYISVPYPYRIIITSDLRSFDMGSSNRKNIREPSLDNCSDNSTKIFFLVNFSDKDHKPSRTSSTNTTIFEPSTSSCLHRFLRATPNPLLSARSPMKKAVTFSPGAAVSSSCSSSKGLEYYNLRSFYIRAGEVFNMGDLRKPRKTRHISHTNSDPSLIPGTSNMERENEANNEVVMMYKIGMLGASEVGKSSLALQLRTSDYIFRTYEKTLLMEYNEKNVYVMLDGEEMALKILDYPAMHMSIESFCSTNNPDVYTVVYSITDQKSFKRAKKILLYLSSHDYMDNHGVILVGNKADLEGARMVSLEDYRNNSKDSSIMTWHIARHIVSTLLFFNEIYLYQVIFKTCRNKKSIRH
ncbi:uncharacterized protein [Anoplolepis gracilipes]|uniref:uncharacterized protein n=1 Tax=Anoplolepis gracilipes TaxID=354296 RepID=UPI003B9F29D9